MVEFPKCRLASWADADRWADVVAARVLSADRVPETLVALTRGGWVPARLIADRLGLRRLVAVRAQHWGVTATPSGQAEITEALNGSIDGQSVLVVDDITDTGQSLALATAHVRDRSARRVESATFLHITHSKFVPTYVAEEIPREAWVWVVFPWNYWEDVRTLSERARAEADSVEGAHRILRERCALDVPLAHVRAALGSAAPSP